MTQSVQILFYMTEPNFEAGKMDKQEFCTSKHKHYRLNVIQSTVLVTFFTTIFVDT